MTNTQTKCEDCKGRGIINSYSYGSTKKPDGYYIEKCDICNVFKSDKEAFRHYISTPLLAMVSK